MNQTIGILGGGQLGKMLFLAGANLALKIYIMDESNETPAGLICRNYSIGDFTDYDDTLSFGEKMDIITIEIEKINVDALKTLEQQGKSVFPQAHIIELIQDKGLQKDFYRDHNFLSSSYKKYIHIDDLRHDLDIGLQQYPFVQKTCKGGYDGRGVQIIRNKKDLDNSFTHDFLIEALVDIKKEIAVVTCRSISGEIVCYDPVEMVFDPLHNILLYQLAPALISEEIADVCKSIAENLSRQLGIVGLLAVEMFITENDEIYINECAPRPHNSGHHTIEACYCSQYENHLRAISGLPLGSPETREKSILMNLLGESGYSGPVEYEGLSEILEIQGVNVHLYGKTHTKPHRKMGHITIIDHDIAQLQETYQKVSRTIKVKSNG
jgi:5-(carboxyamino)imidazole ribonucleotide synthase